MMWANGDWRQVTYVICELFGYQSDNFGKGMRI